MSIASSFSNALSGLSAVSRAADVVSSNIANAMTEGYARRELALSALSVGGQGAGVRVDGVIRVVNQAVLADRRLADAEVGNIALRAEFLNRLETLLGTPGTPGSLSDRIASFETALIEAASRPDSEARLQSVLTSAEAITSHLNKLTSAIQGERMSADQQIAAQVTKLNTALKEIDVLNAKILTARSSGQDASALLDHRQALVDQVAQIVPIREVARDNSQISLFTTGGAVLLEDNPAVIDFAAVGVITADMTLASGALSAASINGLVVSPTDSGVLGGGTLGALFALRDELAPQAQAQIDALARDLIARFEAPALDATKAAGAPGLFTDRAAALDPADEVGLAGRISISTSVDPDQGGALWRLRDGLGAASSGPVGNGTLLTALGTALTATNVPASGIFSGAARSVSGLAADILSQVSGTRQTVELRESYASSRQDSLTKLYLSDGVDTDAEMQNLLQIEQAYAANARVIQTIDEMLQTIVAI